MVTLKDALLHLGFDTADMDDEVITTNVQRALNAAVKRMHGAVGSDVETYLPDDPRTEQLVLLYTEENYDERSASNKQRGARSRLTDDLELQLKLELRRAKEEVTGGGA